MSELAAPGRSEVIALLATFGDRDTGAVAEQLSSLERTWLITKVEEHYDVVLDFSDEDFHQMSTVSGAVEVLRVVLSEPGHG
jgi:hypothetical protein